MSKELSADLRDYMESNQLLDDCSDHSSHRPCSQGSLLLAGRVGDNPENEVEQSLQ